MADEKPFTAKDAKEMAGLSYRQLHDWESRDAIPSDRTRERKWRKFNNKQLFALVVCAEIRRLYGIPVEKIRFVSNFMAQEEANHFAAAVQMMSLGLHVFLMTDFETTFVMGSDLEFNDLMQHGFFRVEDTKPFIFLRLNEIVNRQLSMLKDPIEIEANDTVYNAIFRHKALGVHTQPELDLLQAVRSGEFDRIEVKLRDGMIRLIDTEGEVAPEDLNSADDAVSVKRTSEFETLVVNSRDGQVVSARRRLPKKYTKADNEHVVFAVVVKKPRARARKKRRK